MLHLLHQNFSVRKIKKYYSNYRSLWHSAHKLPRTTKKLLWKPVQQILKLSNCKTSIQRFFNSGECIALFRRINCFLGGNAIYSPIFFFSNNAISENLYKYQQYTTALFRPAKVGFLIKRYVTYPLHTLHNPIASDVNLKFLIIANNYLSLLCHYNPLTHSVYYERWLREVRRVIFFFILLKIKYKGKSYKWFRKNKTLVLRFGYSHMVFIPIPNFFFNKKRGKMKLVFFGTCTWYLKSFLSSAIRWRSMNIYTGRGLRFAKQLVFRKFGKVSAYR